MPPTREASCTTGRDEQVANDFVAVPVEALLPARAIKSHLVLIIEDSNVVSNLFIELGHVVARYSHWSINTGMTTRIGSEIKSHK